MRTNDIRAWERFTRKLGDHYVVIADACAGVNKRYLVMRETEDGNFVTLARKVAWNEAMQCVRDDERARVEAKQATT